MLILKLIPAISSRKGTCLLPCVPLPILIQTCKRLETKDTNYYHFFLHINLASVSLEPPLLYCYDRFFCNLPQKYQSQLITETLVLLKTCLF